MNIQWKEGWKGSDDANVKSINPNYDLIGESQGDDVQANFPL